MTKAATNPVKDRTGYLRIREDLDDWPKSFVKKPPLHAFGSGLAGLNGSGSIDGDCPRVRAKAVPEASDHQSTEGCVFKAVEPIETAGLTRKGPDRFAAE
jgi:hypothetical protein